MLPRYACLALLVLSNLMVDSRDGRAADDDPADRRVTLKKNDRIIFFGDSLTYLVGKEEPPKIVSKGYVRIVREKLNAKHQEKNIEVD